MDAGLLVGMGLLTFGVTGGMAAALAHLVFRPSWEGAVARRLAAQSARELESRDARVAALGSEVSALQAKLQQESSTLEEVGGQLDEYRRANVQWSKRAEHYKARLEDKSAELQRLSKMVIGLREDKPIIRRHTVFLDGAPAGGKSSLLLRVTKLTASEVDVRGLMATAQPKLSEPIFLLSESTAEGLIFHVIRFYDIAGEQGSNMLDVIHQYSTQREAGELVGGEQLGNAIGLVVWDAAGCAEGGAKDPNQEHLTAARMQVAYGSRMVTKVLENVIIFLNKCDVLEGTIGAQAGEAPLEAELQRQRELIRSEVFKKVDTYRRTLCFTSGSALKGNGVHACLGEIVKALGVGHLYGEQGGEALPFQPIQLPQDDPDPNRTGPRRLTFTQTG